MSKRVTVIVEGREYIVEVGDLNESPIKATVNNRTYQVDVPNESASPTVTEMPATASAPMPSVAERTPRGPSSGAEIIAPMPGNIIEVKVKAGDSVKPGDVICVLEAMKMNNKIHADRAGIIATVEVVAGQAVDYGVRLVTFQ